MYLKFSNFKCTSNGHLHQHLLINGSTAQKKEINAFNDPGQSIIFQVTGAPETYRHRGYFYVNRRTSENTHAPGRSRDRYVHPRTIIEGQWITREKTVGNAGATTFRTAAHSPVYKNLFYQTLCSWHAPMVRWMWLSRALN